MVSKSGGKVTAREGRTGVLYLWAREVDARVDRPKERKVIEIRDQAQKQAPFAWPILDRLFDAARAGASQDGG